MALKDQSDLLDLWSWSSCSRDGYQAPLHPVPGVPSTHKLDQAQHITKPIMYTTGIHM